MAPSARESRRLAQCADRGGGRRPRQRRGICATCAAISERRCGSAMVAIGTCLSLSSPCSPSVCSSTSFSRASSSRPPSWSGALSISSSTIQYRFVRCWAALRLRTATWRCAVARSLASRGLAILPIYDRGRIDEDTANESNGQFERDMRWVALSADYETDLTTYRASSWKRLLQSLVSLLDALAYAHSHDVYLLRALPAQVLATSDHRELALSHLIPVRWRRSFCLT